jgi:hypothetical protein
MKRFLILPLTVLFFALSVFAQSKTNEAINKQIKDLNAGKTITLTYDESSKTSKIMVVAEDFGKSQDKRAGVDALNFGMAFFYPGSVLTTAPAEINLTFWVMNEKPKFAEAHVWTATVGGETINLGEARYAARPKENMEYLNFRISRENLEKIARSREVKFKLGKTELEFTPEHLKTFVNFLKISNPAE